jgi:hypothetical protein
MHSYNPSYSEGKDRKIMSLTLWGGKKPMKPCLKNKIKTKELGA